MLVITKLIKSILTKISIIFIKILIFIYFFHYHWLSYLFLLMLALHFFHLYFFFFLFLFLLLFLLLLFLLFFFFLLLPQILFFFGLGCTSRDDWEPRMDLEKLYYEVRQTFHILPVCCRRSRGQSPIHSKCRSTQ